MKKYGDITKWRHRTTKRSPDELRIFCSLVNAMKNIHRKTGISYKEIVAATIKEF